MTPLHRTNELNPRGDGWKPTDVGTLSTYVDILKSVAAEYSIPVLDLFATSGMQPRIEEQRIAFMPDGLHPCDLGHKRIAARLAAFLKSL